MPVMEEVLWILISEMEFHQRFSLLYSAVRYITKVSHYTLAPTLFILLNVIGIKFLLVVKF